MKVSLDYSKNFSLSSLIKMNKQRQQNDLQASSGNKIAASIHHARRKGTSRYPQQRGRGMRGRGQSSGQRNFEQRDQRDQRPRPPTRGRAINMNHVENINTVNQPPSTLIVSVTHINHAKPGINSVTRAHKICQLPHRQLIKLTCQQ